MSRLTVAVLVVVLFASFSCSKRSDKSAPSRSKDEPRKEAARETAVDPEDLDYERVSLPECFDWVALSNVQLLRAAKLMEQSLRKAPRAKDEFGPWPARESCCDLEMDTGKLPRKRFCTLNEYAQDPNGWETIGFTIESPTPFSYFATLTPEAFEASTWADLNCDGEPEFHVELVIPREGSLLKIDERFWRLSANALACIDPD